jgi:hypothetical protein
MSYLPDIYQQFERSFPNVHRAHQELDDNTNSYRMSPVGLPRNLSRGRAGDTTNCASPGPGLRLPAVSGDLILASGESMAARRRATA